LVCWRCVCGVLVCGRCVCCLLVCGRCVCCAAVAAAPHSAPPPSRYPLPPLPARKAAGPAQSDPAGTPTHPRRPAPSASRRCRTRRSRRAAS
jgi:hypothetical protein